MAEEDGVAGELAEAAPLAAAQLVRKRKGGVQHPKVGDEGYGLSQFRHRTFPEDRKLVLRTHEDMGDGWVIAAQRADAWLMGGREPFVELLRRMKDATFVTHYGDAPEDQTARLNCAEVGRPSYTAEEQHKRQACADAKLMRHTSAACERVLEAQQRSKALQQKNGGHPCYKKDPTETCYCERSFSTAAGLANHKKCRFPRAATSTADTAKRLLCDIQQGNNTSAPAGGGSRIDAARAADPGGITEAANGALFSFSVSDDSTQNSAHLSSHRIAAREMQLRAGKLAMLKTYTNQSDGASVYTAPPSWLSLRLMHEVDSRYPRCSGSSQSVAGAGKGGADRLHAELNAKARRALNNGADQTNAHQHAHALVSDGGIKGTMVSVVVVPRNQDSDDFQNLKVNDPGHTAVDGEPPPVAVTDADRDFDPNSLSLYDWLTQRGTFHTTALHRDRTAAGQAFVDECFREGLTGLKSKVHASTARERMTDKVDQGTGLDMFGPGCVGGNVWDIKHIQARYSALLSQQKGSSLLAQDSSPVSAMAHAKCGCGAVKFQQLQ